MALLLADGWEEVPPRKTDRRLVWVDDGKLTLFETDFADPVEFVETGRRVCDLAVDQRAGLVYSLKEGTPQALVAVSVDEGSRRVVVHPPDGFHFQWLLRLSPDGEELVAYLSTRAEKGIQHRLARIDVRSGTLRSIPLGVHAFVPLALSFAQRRILFSTARKGGPALVDFDGELVASIQVPRVFPTSGAFLDDEVVVGGARGSGSFLWDPRSDNLRELLATGGEPVPSVSAGFLWYSEQDSDVHRLDMRTRKTECGCCGRRYDP